MIGGKHTSQFLQQCIQTMEEENKLTQAVA